jgi:hypothetical protein
MRETVTVNQGDLAGRAAGDRDVVFVWNGTTSGVRVPDGVAASVRTRSALASVNVNPARFPRTNGVYRSADYDTARARADIDIEGGLASFSVQ